MSTTLITHIKKIISAYSLKERVEVQFTTKGRTKQSFKDECDINKIMARFIKTRTLDFQQTMQPRYGDSTGRDYQAAMFTVAAANGLFAAMPSHLRSRFDNDPAKFLDFVGDKRNRAEAEDLGLLKAIEEAPPGPLSSATEAPATPLPPTPEDAPAASVRAASGRGKTNTTT